MMPCVLAAGPAARPSPLARLARTWILALCALAIGACAGQRARPLAELEPLLPAQESPIDLIEEVGEAVEAGLESEMLEIPATLAEVLEPEDVRSEFGHLFATETADEVPEVLYDAVLRWVDFFRGSARDRYATWLEREGRYGALIRRELREAGLPEDLVYLAMIESGFSNNAVSRAQAVGMWQFMAPTARDVGLRIDEWVDERRDPVRATRAAIRYLGWLHDQTSSWALSAAAYNAGLGRVTRIQREANETDYFRLVAAGRLPEETRRYVPTILAAALIAHNHERFGFGDVERQEPLRFDTITVEPFTALAAVAEAAQAPEAALRELNPHLIRRAVPPSAPQPVRVPAGTDPALFAERLRAIPAARRFVPREVWTTVAYTVKSGDSWWRIARDHQTTIAELRKQNPSVPEGLRPGMKLQIRKLQRLSGDGAAVVAVEGTSGTPATSGTRTAASATATPATAASASPTTAAAASASAPPAPARVEAGATATTHTAATHVVQSGETLSGLAQRYGVSMADLVAWNGMKEARGLKIGETLQVARVVPAAHKVEPGETMTGLAQRYDLTLEQLARWNGMKEPRPLRAGEMLRLLPPEPSVHTVAAGETMGGLARKYGVTLRDLTAWNGMKEPRGLKIGERLVVSLPEAR